MSCYEPVILDLISTPSLQRLQGVDQSGYPAPFFPGALKHTRFDHSLGVYFLLHRYNAPLEEQIAGLIHDVSHTAFSHCADYMQGDPNAGKTQSHQDDVFASFVRSSEIPEILARHSIDVEMILDDAQFPLKEQPLPDLCADRIDYSRVVDPLCQHSGMIKRLSEVDPLWTAVVEQELAPKAYFFCFEE